MYLNPLAQFVKSLVTGRRSLARRVRRPLRNRQRRFSSGSQCMQVSMPAELLEERALLAGPQLVTVAPNTGGFLTNGQVQTEAPRELTFTFSPGSSINPATLNGGIIIQRAGGDGAFNNGNGTDQTINPGFIGVAVAGNTANQVTLRFSDTLPDDLYRISITGTLQNTAGESFNNGVTQTLDFKVDYGSQVVSLVPQPVLRTQNLNVLSIGKISDLDTFSITAGGSPVTFQFKNTSTNSQVAQGNIAILYNGSDTSTTLAQKIANAVNSASSGLNGKVSANQNGTTVALAGAAFTPVLQVTTAQSGALSVSDGGLVQKRDTIVAYFNQNPLNATLAQDPGFYKVINTADGSILLPSSVTYNNSTNTAVLKFDSNIPAGTFQLTIGAPNRAQNTLGTAVNAGTLFANTGGFTINGYIGNAARTSTAASDVDLFQFSTRSSTTVTINADTIASGLGSNVVLRLFDANGVQIGISNSNVLSTVLPSAGTYYVGVSASGNASYNAVNGTGAVNGVGFGTYRLRIGVSTNLSANNNTTSFGTSTNLGDLGAAGQIFNDAIQPPGNLAYPPYNGGLDEPGHRDLPITQPGREDNASDGGTTPTVPGVLPVQYYNFRDDYGFDPQGNQLHNAITETQKQRAREVFEIWGAYLGIKFVETASTGLIVATGDIRAVAPNLPPDSAGGIGGPGIAIQNGNLNWGNSEYGGSYFQVAFQEIGHALGFHHGNDAPGSMGPGMGGGDTELVFPGDITLQQALRDYAPDSTDINIYQFQVTQSGTFSAETVAQRLKDASGNDNPSLLDSVLTLYKESYTPAQVSSSFNTNGAVTINFIAKALGTLGNGISLSFSKSNLGANAAPTITVNGNQISVVLNTNATGGTTAQRLVDALNSHGAASALLSASLVGGGGSTNISTPSINYSPLTLTGGTTSRTIVARNDDYFGRDSFVNLHLDTGTYYLAVSSTGNTNFDPTVADTGYGGRTDGLYQLKMNFSPDATASSTLNDAAGIPLDGNADAITGGIFNFWFQSNTASNTIFVDKANAADLNQDGTIAHPYSDIATALGAATPGSVVRIVGNGGTDGDSSSLGDNKAYLIGFDTQGNVASDGSEFKVPQGVTVMIDAGAIIKLRGAVVDVGASVPNVDRSGGALQVLGTPGRNVYFTSLRDNAIGGNTDPTNFTGVQAGNWGGIVFRQQSDVQGLDYQGKGIFLNSVNQANVRYGGGQVLEDSVLQVFNPIHISNPDGDADFFTRPAVWNNTITQSADAAMSADPNSFYNSLDRVGPDIHGNRVVSNTINGLFIRIRTQLGESIDKLEVPARIDESDITYVLSENLFIQGQAGGPLMPNPFDAAHTGWDARVAGSLVIDPGVIMKISGARIEAQIGGSQLIAEGDDAHKVIFTSLKDDTYGAGGAFDTGADGQTTVLPGDWGGFFFNTRSSGSIDSARILYAGGTTPIAGGFSQFNAVEIQQANVRIANSLFQNNANGDAGGSNRNGLLTNGPATIFVRGAQPTIVNNTFVANAGNIVSINANSLNFQQAADPGRRTGSLGAFTEYVNNHGPLVRLNRMANNGTNGMEVRGESIMTETIWDDTDIVHVVRSLIHTDLNLHTYDGIRLQSSLDASLVVKLLGANAGFSANGIPLDINDRIGGTLQIIGTPGHPVILTSLNDDTVGAGFRPDGQPQLDTNNNGSATIAQPGDWKSILLDRYSNDRNVSTYIESELIANGLNTNATPATAEFLGNLAPSTPSDNSDNAKGGNDDQPLGFSVNGFLNKATDSDVYSFNAAGGTEVWFDISRTSQSLDTILELIDSNGNILASSNDSQFGTRSPAAGAAGLEMGIVKDPLLGGDFYTLNPKDAGFRAVLPGQAGVNGTYFIRVRSNGGLTQGEYKLQVRLQQVYEHPGSTIRFADIRYATNGIEIRGLPGHSPLGGDSASIGTNNSFANAQDLGNLMKTDTNTISVSGALATSATTEWYKFQLNYDLIQSIAGHNGADKTWATIFDIDFADGLARPDLTLSVYDDTGKLILISRDSNVNDDQPGPLQGTGLTDVSRGSAGKNDPFLGSVQMPIGPPTTVSLPGNPTGGGTTGPGQQGTSKTYYVAISSNIGLPTALDATFRTGATNSLIRMEPVSSIRRIVEDHIGFTGYRSGDPQTGSSNVQPTTPAILPIATAQQLSVSVRPFTLSDVVAYVTTPGDSRLRTIDAYNGSVATDIGQATDNLGQYPITNIQMRNDGTLWGVQSDFTGGTNRAGRFVRIDPATGTQTIIGLDGIPDYDPNANPPNPFQLNSSTLDSFVWIPAGVGNYLLFYAAHDGGFSNPNYNAGFGASRWYRADPGSGAVYLPTDGRATVGEITASTADSTIGFTTGMIYLNGTVYGVSTGGKLFTINTGNGRATIIKDFAAQGLSFSGLSLGPQNLAGGLPGQTPVAGFFADKLFATTDDGQVYCLDTAGNLLPVFVDGATSANFGLGSRGFAFSPLDFNLWHPTMQRHADAGHGINSTFDNTRRNPVDFRNTINGRDSTEGEGGASFYFGLESWVNNPVPNNYFTYGANAQYGILTSDYHRNLTSNASAAIGNNYNLPGGAYGSLVTGSFDLKGYSSTEKPALYFDYFLETDNTNHLTDMRDSARVFISSDGGQTWEMLATNNSIRSFPADPAELPQYLTASRGENTNAANQQVQELFDNTGGWRQARVDLGAYAGLSNLQLRFDFSTAGAMIKDNARQGLPGDSFGVGPTKAERGQDNNRVGFYVDDIIIGFAGRGEMVTGAVAGQTGFFLPNPNINADPNVPKQSLTGAYQLEIRRGTEYGINPIGSSPSVVVTNQLDISDRLAPGWSIHASPGAGVVDGQTFTISDGVKTVTFEYTTDATVTAGNVAVGFSQGDPDYVVAARIRDAINNAASNGLFKVTASLGDDTLSGFGSTNTRVDLYQATGVSTSGGANGLSASIVGGATSINETGAGNSATVRITRTSGVTGDLQVVLTALDPTTGGTAGFVSFGQNPIIIPNGQSFVDVTITGLNNASFSGNRTVVIIPTAVGFSSLASRIDVLDDEAATLTINVTGGATSVQEGNLLTATVSRNTPTDQDLVVTLASLIPSELTVPQTITIPAGQTTSGPFVISAVQDGSADGSKDATIVAYAQGFTPGQQTLTVTDSLVQYPIAAPGTNVNISQLAGNQSNGSLALDTTTSGASQRLFMASNVDTLTTGNSPFRFVGGLLTSYSTNGGLTWTNKIIADGNPPAPGDDVMPIASGWAATASDGFGNLFVAYLNKVVDGNNNPIAPNQIIILKSSNFGQTFQVHQVISAQFSSLGLGAPALAAARLGPASGSLWVSYYDNALGKLVALGAPVTGLGQVGAFGATQQIGGSDFAGSQVPSPLSIPNIAPEISISPTGAVMVAFQTGQGQNGSVISISVDPDGLGNNLFPVNPTSVAFTNVGGRDLIPAQSGSGHGISAGISLAWDRSGGAHNGRIYMAYTSETVDEQNNMNILLRFSDNNGQSWSAPQQVNSDTTLNSQFLPRIAVDQTSGNVAIVWYDARNDEAGGSANSDGIVNNEVQLWGAIAGYPAGVGGALVIGPNVQISAGTSKASSAGNGFTPGSPTPTNSGVIDFGDRLGVAFDQGRFFPLWADNSTALPDSTTAPRLEMATAAVLDTLTPNPFAPATIRVSLISSTVAENGSAVAQVELLDFQGNPVNATGSGLVVRLVSSDPTLASMPATVTIPAGTSSQFFFITPANNGIAQGTQTLVVTPVVAALNSSSAALQINDDETQQLTVGVSAGSGTEGNTLTGTVTRNGDTTQPLEVFLTSTDNSEIAVPVSVIIPANQASVTFTISLLQDFQADGSRIAGFIASAPGYRSAAQSVTVQDSGRQAIEVYDRLGDRNTVRKQGVIAISSNTISNVSQSGIVVTSGARDGTAANLPHPGSVINGPVLNNERLLPGPQISNNVIYNFQAAGIQFSGDSNPSGMSIAGAPYGRIVNNTIFGGLTATGTGILVSNNAAPTLLNNIVARTETGISIDGSSASRTVVGTTLFQGNTANGTLGTNPILLGAAQPLFINPATGNFYLRSGSLAIDSSLNTLQDRPSIVNVKSPLGIPQSPIIAPTLDRFGQLRLDDPSVPNATGLGQNIFKDRGAVERADFVGPSGRLTDPLDNQAGVDGDATVGTVFIISPSPLTEFEVEFSDNGIGIDNSTVLSSAIVLRQDGVTLVEGVDYVTVYNANTHRFALKSVSVFPSTSNYTITVDTSVVKDLAGNSLQGNQADGSLLFTIIGNAPPSLTQVTPFQGLKNIPLTITYAQLLAASDLSVVATHTANFRIESITNGTLTITKSGSITPIAVVPGVTLLELGDVLTWTPPSNITGNTAAFTVSGFDPENAVIAPALSTSSNPVSVNVNLVNRAPRLTTVTPLAGATEDTSFLITYNTLRTASDLSDDNNDSPLAFRITEISSGILEISPDGISFTPVVAGVTLVTPTDTLRWTPAGNANSTINGGPLNAFKIVATDGSATSVTPVQVPVDVAATPDRPILSTIGTFGLAGKNSPFRITYGDLLANSNSQNVDGHSVQFRIESVVAGATLVIRPNGSATNQAVVAGTTVVNPGDTLFWTPPTDVFGSGIDAFTLIGYDSFNATNFPSFATALAPVTAKVDVSSETPPTMTTIGNITKPRFVPSTITYNEIVNASNVSFTAGHTLGFRVDTLTTGTLSITRNGSTTTVIPGTTIVLPGDTLTWTSVANATGVNPAFTLFAIDQNSGLTSLDSVQVNVDLVNVAPTLTSVGTLTGVTQQTPIDIPFNTLKTLSNAQDANNDTISFRIESVNGTLTITKSGTNNPVPVASGTTIFSAGDKLTWTPPNGASGNSIQAFTIRAFDGLLLSSSNVQVSANVTPFGAGLDLSGPWVVGGKLARISQNGTTLTYNDQNGMGSSGGYVGASTVTGRNGLTGVVDVSTADQGRIIWSDGVVWTRISLGGQYFNPANNGLVSIAQNGIQLTFTNVVGATTTGTFLSVGQVSLTGWGQTATILDGVLTMSGGSVWKKLNVSPDYRNATGDAVHILQNGTTSLTFVNKVGGTSAGKWISPTQVQATDWGTIGTVTNGQIKWNNNTFWNKDLTVFATGGGSGLVSVTATNAGVTLTNKSGGTSQARITGPNTIVALNWGVTGTRNNGRILWSNGTVWDNFDFNALDSVFSDVRQFPFG